MSLNRQITLKKALSVALHLLIWVSLTAFAVSEDADLDLGLFNRRDGTLTWPVCYGAFFNAILFYGNAFWLMPRLVKQRKRYLLLVALNILILTVLESGIDVWYALQQAPILEKTRAVFQSKMQSPWTDDFIAPLLAVQSFLPTGFIHLVVWAFSLAYGLYRDWVRNERVQETLLREKMIAELNFLRAQINPHFLFNGINSIYHLIDEDADKAKDVLVRFSGLLRYQLYECSSDSILLNKELDYLENYITLENIRKGGDAVVEYAISCGPGSWKIAPMLLTPLIENAFKYLSQYTDSNLNRLDIELCVENGWLDVYVKNTYQSDLRDRHKPGGLGLQNVRNRLSLLYPERHQLAVAENGSVFEARLQIQLDHA